MPQALNTKLDCIKKNSKSSFNSLPTKVMNGLLWVWPSSGSDARILSELTLIVDMSLERSYRCALDFLLLTPIVDMSLERSYCCALEFFVCS